MAWMTFLGHDLFFKVKIGHELYDWTSNATFPYSYDMFVMPLEDGYFYRNILVT